MMRQVRAAWCAAMRHVRVAWCRTLDAPHLPLALWLAFLGITTLIVGPDSTGDIEHILPEWLTWTWAGAMAAGGLLVAVGVLAARGRQESAGHALLAFSLGQAALVFGLRGVLEAGIVVGVVFLGAVSGIRLWQLRRERAAEQEARRRIRVARNGGR